MIAETIYLIIITTITFGLTIYLLVLKYFEPKDFDINLDIDQLKETVNKQIDNKLTSVNLVKSKQGKKLETSMIKDFLNNYIRGMTGLDGLFNQLENFYPDTAKNVIEIARKNIDFETGEINPQVEALLQRAMSLIPLEKIQGFLSGEEQSEKQTDEKGLMF